jgi:hypothetical protein
MDNYMGCTFALSQRLTGIVEGMRVLAPGIFQNKKMTVRNAIANDLVMKAEC